jgi:hypothetical protein
MAHTVRVYGSDEATGTGVALLEEHDFTGLDEASECARQLERDGAGLVTLNAAPRFAIKATVHDWGYTYSGITAEEAQGIADTLTEGSGEESTVEPIAR